MANVATNKARANDVLEWIWYAYNNGFGYIWGTCWIVWTAAKQKAATREMTVKYGSKWIGHYVCDCANLLRGAFKKVNVNIHAGSNLIFDCDLKAYGRLKNGKRTDGKELLPCTAVFTGDTEADHDHVGMYVGNGEVIEAKGTIAGVIKSKITDDKWKWWGEFKDVDYSDASSHAPSGTEQQPSTVVALPTLRKGSKGEYVTLAQTKLLNKGYDLGSYGVDGDFGSATEKAVKQFQQDHGLTADGVIGEKSWEKLNEQGTNLYTVTIPSLPKFKAEALIKQYTGASMTEERG